MTSRRSSGSIRAESAVDPTRSENITVTWRRSAVSWVFEFRSGAQFSSDQGPASKFADGSEQFTPTLAGHG